LILTVFYRLNLGDLEDSAVRLNELYGGLNPKGTQVVYTIGELDPWHGLGNHQGTPDSPVIVIQGTASQMQNRKTTA
jgi:Serine carboxypeptidase S28